MMVCNPVHKFGSWKQLFLLFSHDYFWFDEEPTHRKRPWSGKDWRQKEKGSQRMRWIDRIIDSMERDLRKLWEIVKDREAWHAAVYELQRVRHNLVTEQQNFCFLTRSGELKCVITNFLLCICTSYILLNKST